MIVWSRYGVEIVTRPVTNRIPRAEADRTQGPPVIRSIRFVGCALAVIFTATILSADPALATARGEALRTLLYLFERDAAIAYARAG